MIMSTQSRAIFNCIPSMIVRLKLTKDAAETSVQILRVNRGEPGGFRFLFKGLEYSVKF